MSVAPLELVVDTIDVIQLVKVDVVSQRFEGTFLLGLRIEGGAISPDLSNVDDAVVN